MMESWFLRVDGASWLKLSSLAKRGSTVVQCRVSRRASDSFIQWRLGSHSHTRWEIRDDDILNDFSLAGLGDVS